MIISINYYSYSLKIGSLSLYILKSHLQPPFNKTKSKNGIWFNNIYPVFSKF